MLQTFYHVNLDWSENGIVIWSPELEEKLYTNAEALSVLPSQTDANYGWSFNHLFIASECANVLQSILKRVNKEGVSLVRFSMKSTGLEEPHTSGAMTEIKIIAHIEVDSEEDADIVERLLRTSRVGRSRNSDNTKITIKPFIEISSLV